MEIEKQRGISVASSVMQMEYRDCVINLLDTPGHQDFSEDTYRVLTAVDAALMVIDAANGVEPQTRRLLQVCRARNTPILTFVNKMDREVQEPLELMDEIERELGMEVVPFTWPVGMGKSFHGVMDLREQRCACSSPARTATATPTTRSSTGWTNPVYAERFGAAYEHARRRDRTAARCRAARSTPTRFLAGHQTPMFFGSAINNFGVREVLDALVDLAPPPGERDGDAARGAARRAEVQRRRVQDPGQHGPGAPRPHRLRARGRGPLRTRHAAEGGALGQGTAAEHGGVAS